MSTEFYTVVFCGTSHILVLISLHQKIKTITFDLADDYNSCLKDFINQLIQKSELIWKDPYGWRYYLN
jgi:hypothetical protein